MAALPFGAYGVLLLLFRGLLHTVQLSLGRMLKEWGWPYFRMMAAACFLASLPIAAALAALGTPLPEPWQRKWVALRGLFGAGGFVCSVLAAQTGAPLGDVEALRSINMVAAALLGRLLLGEELVPSAIVGLCCSVGGAVLISQPSCLFGGGGGVHGTEEVAWLGYALALASGLCQACVFVASRKVPGTSLWVQAFSSHIMSSAAAGLLPAAGAVEDFSLAPLLASPVQATLLFAALFGNTFVSTVTLSAAAQWCTAAESAVVSTSAGMGFGFAAQMELFGTQPDRLSLAGAMLMLSGVVAMALSQAAPAGKTAHGPEEEAAEADAGLVQQPLLLTEAPKPLEPGLLPAASDISTCDTEQPDVEDISEELDP